MKNGMAESVLPWAKSKESSSDEAACINASMAVQLLTHSKKKEIN